MFVPVVPRDATPTVQAQELAQRLEQTIAEYRQRHPDLSEQDIRQAAQLASHRGEARPPAATRVALVLATSAALLGGVLFVAAPRTGNAPPVAASGSAIVAVIVAVLAVILVIRSRASRD